MYPYYRHCLREVGSKKEALDLKKAMFHTFTYGGMRPEDKDDLVWRINQRVAEFIRAEKAEES